MVDGLAGRIDGLSLVLGVASVLVVAIAATGVKDEGRNRVSARVLLSVFLLLIGLLMAAFSRHVLELWLGWEVAGLGVWLALGPATQQRFRLLLVLHAPGWVLLEVWLLSLAFPFTPPAGGAMQTWHAAVVLAFAIVVLVRAGCWPFDAWMREPKRAEGAHARAMLGIYAMVGPFLLAKALVAARWDPAGVWLMALAGMAGLLGTLYSIFSNSKVPVQAVAPLHAAAAMVGFALAPGSPLAAVGAVALTLSGLLWVVTLAGIAGSVGAGPWRTAGGWSALLGGGLGVWAVSQGALDLGYGIVTALLLPAGTLLIVECGMRRPSRLLPWPRNPQLLWVGLALLVVGAIYPQAVIEWVLRPGVAAMAGGVRALRGIALDWGVGVQVLPLDETLVASLPATGLAFAVFLAVAVLYWLKRLVTPLIKMKDEG